MTPKKKLNGVALSLEVIKRAQRAEEDVQRTARNIPSTRAHHLVVSKLHGVAVTRGCRGAAAQ